MTNDNMPIECAKLGCTAIRRLVNNWFVVEKTKSGAHIHRWKQCPDDVMKSGKKVCGLEHAFYCASSMMTPDTTDVNRESTLVLAPPVNSDGTHNHPIPISVVEETKEPEKEV